MKRTASEIADRLRLTCIGKGDIEVECVSPVEDPDPRGIVFIESESYLSGVIDRCQCVLAASSLKDKMALSPSMACLFTDTPRLSFIALLRLFDPYADRVPQTDPLASSRQVAQSAGIGHGCILGENAVIEESVHLMGGNYVGRDVKVGRDTVVFPGAQILDGSRIGSHCVIGANAVIGGEGFGYEKTEEGLMKIPHIGNVILEDRVEVGSGTCIDRATVGSTLVGHDTKIDNLVQIAHNVKIGAHYGDSGSDGDCRQFPYRTASRARRAGGNQ